MKNKKLFVWIAVPVLVFGAVCGALAVLNDAAEPESDPGALQNPAVEEQPEVQLSVREDEVIPENSGNSAVQTEVTSSDREDEVIPGTTEVAAPDVTPYRLEEESDDMVKTYVDTSPEKKLADFKARVSSGAEQAKAVTEEKKALEAEKALLTASDRELSDGEKVRLGEIESRLEQIWLNHSIMDDPNYWEEENYFQYWMNMGLKSAKYDLEHYARPGSYEEKHNTLLVTLFETCLAKYENGEAIDDIYLYYFEELDRITRIQW
ncbi:MAG: hypothetical protein IKZ19_04455 [Clostridia bacterium]|nr:hypothetical protein [Clostridia bacterium]